MYISEICWSNALWLCLFAFLTGCASAGPASSADYASLREEAVRQLQARRAATARAAEAGIEVAREQVTITAAELFLTWADWDRGHPKELEKAIASWWRSRKNAAQLAIELPVQEMRDS